MERQCEAFAPPGGRELLQSLLQSLLQLLPSPPCLCALGDRELLQSLLQLLPSLALPSPAYVSCCRSRQGVAFGL